MVFSLSVFGQSQSLKFTLQSNDIEIEGSKTGVKSTIIKQGNQLFWTQHIDDREMTSTYKIKEKNENWNKENSQGELEYVLDENGYQSTLTISGDSNGISIILSSVESNGQKEDFVFKINTITYN